MSTCHIPASRIINGSIKTCQISRNINRKLKSYASKLNLDFRLSNEIQMSLRKSFFRLHEAVKHWNFCNTRYSRDTQFTKSFFLFFLSNLYFSLNFLLNLTFKAAYLLFNCSFFVLIEIRNGRKIYNTRRCS